jgi:3-hydroxy-9,10-secoandrosta-1,3,5(10)-triene-9,17-dione monooxygenase reductase component
VADSPDPSRELPDAVETRHSGLSSDDPFATPLEERRLDRRFRGRLVAPVTVWTAGSGDRRAGLTVSSLLVAEGDPAEVLGLLDPLSELFDVLVERGSFVVHVLETADQRLAGMFAGAYPVDPFEEVDTVDGEFGPVISGTRHTLGCRLVGSEELGFQMLVRGSIEALEIVADAGQPLIRYRGRYRKLSPES